MARAPLRRTRVSPAPARTAHAQPNAKRTAARPIQAPPGWASIKSRELIESRQRQSTEREGCEALARRPETVDAHHEDHKSECQRRDRGSAACLPKQ